MAANPSSNPAPEAVLHAIDEYLADLAAYFTQHNITYTATCDVVAGTSVDNQIWEAGAQPDATMFVGSAIKTFILAEFLRSDLPETAPTVIDDTVRSISSSVFGDETLAGQPEPDMKLDGKTLMRNVLEAMISHSDNTATDAVLAAVGVDQVRELISQVGLSSVEIPESTRRLFAYLASGQNADVDWETLNEYVDNPPDKQDPINDVQSMLASAADMVRWYQTALQDPSFFDAGDLAEFKRISAMADALHRIVPDNLASFGKGGSITWNNFSCISVSGQMEMPTMDPGRPWVPLTFSFNINWGREDQQTFNDVAGILVNTAKDVLKASLDDFFWTVVNFALTVAADNLSGTSGRDDFAGPGGGLDSLHGLGGDDSFHIRASQTGLISGGNGYDTVHAIDSQLDSGLTFDTVEALNASETSLHATVAQLVQFSRIVPAAGGPHFDVVLQNAGGELDFSSRFVSPVLLRVDAAGTSSGVVLVGTAHDDSLSGSSFNDTLIGGHGDDMLNGGIGADTLSGGDGDDSLLIDSQDVGIAGGAGFDSALVQTSAAVTLNMGTASIEWARGNDGADTFDAASQTGAVYIYGMAGNDTITGSALGDFLDGGDGIDILAGGDGADLLFGNGGSDVMLGQGGDDSLVEMGGDSQIDGGAGFDSLFVWSDSGLTLNLATASIEWVQGSVLGADTLNGAGNTVNTFLYGWGGNDTLTGGSADDYIAGGAGNDILTGRAGNDTLIGEAGVNQYVYTATAWGADTIHSFHPNADKLDFTAVAAIDSFADFTTFEWDPGNLGYTSTTLFYTDGGTTSAITLIGVQVASLSNADFLFA